MKRAMVLVLATAVVLSYVGLVGCGGKSVETTQAPGSPSGTSPTTTAPASSLPSAGGLTWNDMPIYSGAGQIQKGSWSIPPAEGDYGRFEWRYYESSDSLEKVAAFYKSQMTAKGWAEQGWMEIQEMNWGMFNKNNENDAAMVWVSTQEGKTTIALWRASK